MRQFLNFLICIFLLSSAVSAFDYKNTDDYKELLSELLDQVEEGYLSLKEVALDGKEVFENLSDIGAPLEPIKKTYCNWGQVDTEALDEYKESLANDTHAKLILKTLKNLVLFSYLFTKEDLELMGYSIFQGATDLAFFAAKAPGITDMLGFKHWTIFPKTTLVNGEKNREWVAFGELNPEDYKDLLYNKVMIENQPDFCLIKETYLKTKASILALNSVASEKHNKFTSNNK